MLGLILYNKSAKAVAVVITDRKVAVVQSQSATPIQNQSEEEEALLSVPDVGAWKRWNS